MGTIVTVHGTFAHIDVAPAENDQPVAEAWWGPDSGFAAEVKSLVACDGGEAQVLPFNWSGKNSERARRKASHDLFQQLLQLEKAGEPYCIVAHSHGGSVVSAALLEAAYRRKDLPGLKRWITVGTPFIELRRERSLFMRLPILLKAMYVASIMLLVVFLGATAGRYWDGDIDFAKPNALWWIGIGGIASSLPFVVFLITAFVSERRRRYFNRASVKARARDAFAHRWLALTHEDDEAVRGLGTLRSVDVPIFDKQFAVPLLSLMSVFMLPAMYLYAIYSPSLMMSLADILSTRVYQLDKLELRVQSYEQTRSRVRGIRVQLKDARKVANDDLMPHADRVKARSEMRERRSELREQRRVLHTVYPDLPKLQRALRFKARFLERAGRPCNNGRLCEDGTSVALNAKLLQHLITDELSSLFLDEEVQLSAFGRLAGYLLPIILVPVIFGLFAVAWVVVVQLLARGFSGIASRWLDQLTWAQVRRTAVGNDTEDEVAVGTAPYPKWIGARRRFLPGPVGRDITDRSNEATVLSLAKFRNALSEFAFKEQGERRSTEQLLAYLNWNELIHTSYFSVSSFKRLVAFAIANSDGFTAKPELANAPERTDLVHWLEWLAPEEQGSGDTPR